MGYALFFNSVRSMQTNTSLALILEPYKQFTEQLLHRNMSCLGPPSPLRDACEYALSNGGKRFRPALVLMIAKALNYQVDVSQAALAIEYFHTASLIADDLPCMDNDDERRNKPTVHKMFGESIALLATYALISAGYHCLVENGHAIKESKHPLAHQSDHLCVLALENASYNTGILGATGGQYLDIAPPALTEEAIRDIIYKKTVTLFEISFVFGWIFGGGDLAKLPLVKKAAFHFGMAFQIADDIDDMEQDLAHHHPVNLAIQCGKREALRMFHEEIRLFQDIQQSLELDSPDLLALVAYLHSLVSEQ
jgi:geranylgeranyl diphosphate synthase, type II